MDEYINSGVNNIFSAENYLKALNIRWNNVVELGAKTLFKMDGVTVGIWNTSHGTIVFGDELKKMYPGEGLIELCGTLEDFMEDLEGYQYDKINKDAYDVTTPDGNKYSCTRKSGKWNCSCMGYKHRKNCKHVANLPAAANPIRHPRQVIDDMMPELHTLFDEFGKWEVVGSYRRKVPDFKDIDVLIECDPGTFGKVYSKLAAESSYKETMHGPDIIRGTYKGYDFDLTRVNQGEWGAYLMYRTGSKDFNIKMRASIKAKGWKLNEHGLFDQNGTKLGGETEKSIFDALGMAFINPEDRS